MKPAYKAAQLWGCDPLWLGLGEGEPNWGEPLGSAPPPPEDLVKALAYYLKQIPRGAARDAVGKEMALLRRHIAWCLEELKDPNLKPDDRAKTKARCDKLDADFRFLFNAAP